MPQRKKSRVKTALVRAKNSVRGAKNPLQAFDRARLGLDIGELVQFADWFRLAEPQISLALKVASIGDLCHGTILRHGTLEDARKWAVASLLPHVGTVRRYIEHRNAFERHVAAGHYELALINLETLEQDVGFSIWSIEQKIFLLHRTSGLEAQKKYTDELLKIYPERSLVSFLSHWISQRNESDEVAYTLVRRLMDQVQHWELSDNLKSFIDYILSENFDKSDASLKGILQRAAASSIIDLYEAFVHTSRAEIVRKGMAPNSGLKQSVRAIAMELSDWRLQNVFEMLSQHEPERNTQRLFCLASQSSQSKVGVQGGSSEWALEVVAYNATSVGGGREWLNKNKDSAPIHIQEFFAAVDSEDDFPAEVYKVLGFVTNSNKLAFSKVLKAHLDQHFTANVWAANDNGLAFLNLESLTPYCLRYVPSRRTKRALFQQFVQATGVSDELVVEAVRAGVGMEFVEENATISSMICPQERLLMRVDNALWNKDYSDAVQGSRELLDENSEELVRWGARSMSQALLASGAISDLVKFLVERRIIHGQSGRGLPLDECVKSLTRKERELLSSGLELVILLDLHNKEVDSSQADYRDYAYEDVLLLNGCTRPSELAEQWPDNSDPYLIYYLKEVCINDVMQTSSEFASTKELDEERIKVLTALVRLDPKNSKEYEDETREIARSQLIQQGVREVGQSKIFVDLASIRRWAEKNIQPDFLRFQLLVDAGMGGDAAALTKAFFQAIDQGAVTADLLEVPKNEAADLLIKIVRRIFTKCMSDPEHGLDCFLSMRIRHGTLSGQLRSPLEQLNMITRREAEAEEYQKNSYWEQQLDGKTTYNQIEQILKILQDFSRSYDEFVGVLSQELIQVHSDKRPNGLLKVELMRHRFVVFYHELDRKTDFNDFLDRCFDLFYESLERSLERTRNVINTKCKSDVTTMFQRLEDEVSKVVSPETVSELIRSSRTAQTNSLQALNVVADWFRLPKNVEAQNFPLEVMIDVGSTCVTTIYPDFRPSVHKNVPELPPIAHALTMFSDLFFILFDNIRQHSGITPSPDVIIDVEDRGDHLRIRTTNPLSSEKDLDQVREAIETSRRRIASGRYQDAIPTEGGTGLIKLWRTIHRSLEIENTLLFDLDDEERFYVEFAVSKREIRI